MSEILSISQKELEVMKINIARLQAEIDEKMKNTNVMDKKINDLNNQMKDVESNVKNEIEKASYSQNDNHKAISNQISGLSEDLKQLNSTLHRPPN